MEIRCVMTGLHAMRYFMIERDSRLFAWPEFGSYLTRQVWERKIKRASSWDYRADREIRSMTECPPHLKAMRDVSSQALA